MALASAIFGALSTFGAFASSGAGATLLAAGVGAGASAYSSSQASKAARSDSAPFSAPIALPKPPDLGAVAEKTAEVIRKKRAAMTQTIYTSPLGSAGEANVVRKTLLGQ